MICNAYKFNTLIISIVFFPMLTTLNEVQPYKHRKESVCDIWDKFFGSIKRLNIWYWWKNKSINKYNIISTITLQYRWFLELWIDCQGFHLTTITILSSVLHTTLNAFALLTVLACSHSEWLPLANLRIFQFGRRLHMSSVSLFSSKIKASSCNF